MNFDQTIAYFSMEIALRPEMPTYSGGLGVLAGDTIRSAADLRVPMVAVSLVHRRGYFIQKLDASGWQAEGPADWPIADYCEEQTARAHVIIEGRWIHLRAWQFLVTGVGGHQVPVLLLDADLPENSEFDRTLTNHLYGGDNYYRLCQEIILGIGGVRALRALGYRDASCFHMNEGHAALLGLELLDEHARWCGRALANADDVRAIRERCVFTTHTPVPAGHDKFPLDMVRRTLGRGDFGELRDLFCCDGELNLTYLALNLSRYVNGVAKKHGEVSRKMLQPTEGLYDYRIDHITNGVHLATWTAPSFAELFDRHVQGWRQDNASLRGALKIPKDEVWQAHTVAKERLIQAVNGRTQAGFDAETLTLGFGRRAAPYKRANLLLSDWKRLKHLAGKAGGLQFVYAGKAHPRDEHGKQLIQEIVQAREKLLPEVRLVYLENYNWDIAQWLIPGVDVWLNTPQPPLEASGTSGMKAALNGVPSLSVLDGWWLEGCIEHVTGWAIGEDCPVDATYVERLDHDVASLYQKLEEVVIPTFYEDRQDWLRIMRHAIALNASHFNTERMVQEYVLKAYFD